MKKTLYRKSVGILILFIVICFNGSAVVAQNELSDSMVNRRLQYLKSTLEKDKAVTQYWWYGWLSLYSAATIGQGAVYFVTDDKGLKQDMVLGAATTFLGAAGQFISPFIPEKNIDKLMEFPEDLPEDRKEKLIVAEALLVEYATREKMALTWQNHILPTSVNLAGGLITWLGFKRSIWAGIGNFALNTAITELQIWTQPKLAKRRYDHYCNNYLYSDHRYSNAPEVKWTLYVQPGGLGLSVVF